MLKPTHLSPGDKVAVVSLSSGILGEPPFIHKYHIAKERLERDYGLRVEAMPNALRGADYLYRHPEARAQDLMDAFRDPSIRAVFCAIGGDDTIRLLPYIDFDVLRDNPKIFTGFSDTVNRRLSTGMLWQEGSAVSLFSPVSSFPWGSSTANSFPGSRRNRMWIPSGKETAVSLPA